MNLSLKNIVLFIATFALFAFSQETSPKGSEIKNNETNTEPTNVQLVVPISVDSSSKTSEIQAAVDSSVNQKTDLKKEPPLNTNEIGGNIHGMLSVENSPYIVTKNLTVENEKTLFIQAGVTLLFKPGTGLYVNNGNLTIAGNNATKVTLKSSEETSKAGSWKGIYLTGPSDFNLSGVNISDAEVGIAIEQGTLNLQSSKIENTSSRGLYVRDANANIMASEISKNKGVGLHAGNYATINADHVKFYENKFALLNSELANTIVLSSELNNNEYAVVGKENNLFYFHNTNVNGNKNGAAGLDVMDESVIASVKNNEKDFGSISIELLATLPQNPKVPYVEQRLFNPNDKIGVLNNEIQKEDSSKKWTLMGNVMLGGNFHHVLTSKNNTNDDFIIGNDTIYEGDKFKNTFQVPGFGAELSAYLYMQSNDGKSIEFNTDITSDSWNHFSPNPVTLSYKDNYNQVILGDNEKVGGEIYLSGLSLFGIDYTFNFLKNNADEPLFEFNGFFGEAKRSLVPGNRHPDFYKTYIENDNAQAQRLAYGGSFKWAPVRRFDAKIGAIYASDELDDPLFRDGADKNATTIDPMIDAFTIFADGNWLFFPGDIELNGQIAVGRADTSDVIRERAINKVFSDAGISVSSFSSIRGLMQNPEKISTLKHEDLIQIFDERSSLRDSEMKDSLRTLIREAKKVQKTDEDDRDDGRVLGENWGSQNFAINASLNWNINKTHIYGHIKYVGEDFYSAGSENELTDYRQFDANFEQEVFDFWLFGIKYEIDVENAANGSKTNLFGFSEGTRFGLFTAGKTEWYDEHELDIDRTKYTQNIGTDHKFNIGKLLTLTAGYNFQFQKQYRPYQIQADYSQEAGIFNDKWFETRKGKTKTKLEFKDETIYVDSLRWALYSGLYEEDFIASKFQEKIFKHSFYAGVSTKALNSTFKLNGRWTIRADGSEFYKDSLIKDFDFHDTTWAKLGYYFGGSNYFEHSYPLSVSTSIAKIQNQFSVTPRIKNYKRNDMDEFEISINDELEFPILNRFVIFNLSGEYRYMKTSWTEYDKNYDESETDILSNLGIRINHNKNFYSIWNIGAEIYSRPDDASSEYSDIFGGIQLNYIF